MSLGAPELLIVLAVMLLLFGAKKVPDLARSLGQAKREFDTGTKNGIDETPAPPVVVTTAAPVAATPVVVVHDETVRDETTVG